jgi:hypothetical protein
MDARDHVPSWLLLSAAPFAAVIAGLATHWWDLRQALLLPVGLAVLATSFALAKRRTRWQAFLLAVAVGAVTWGGAQTVYILAHLVAGEPLDAGRFGPQWAQALGLVAAHVVFLGIPTGAVAGLLLNLPPLHALRLRFADAV